jgi:fatty acid desaturase
MRSARRWRSPKTAVWLMAPTTDVSQEVGAVSKEKQAPFDASTLRVAAWAGVVLAAIGLLGLIYAPSMLPVWIVMLVFAVTAVPQALFALRREKRDRRGEP